MDGVEDRDNLFVGWYFRVKKYYLKCNIKHNVQYGILLLLSWSFSMGRYFRVGRYFLVFVFFSGGEGEGEGITFGVQ